MANNIPKTPKLDELEKGLKDRKLPRDKKFPYVKLALDKEFGGDDTKRPGVPQIINFNEVRAIINQTINTDVDADYFKELAHRGDED